MIVEYHRPDTLEEALSLLSRKDTKTVVIGGGLYINEIDQDPLAVVDLQHLELSKIAVKGKKIHLGGSAVLQTILDHEQMPKALKDAISHQETYNRRQVATLAGSIVVGNGRSSIVSVFLALDADILFQEKKKQSDQLKLGDFLPVRKEFIQGKVITEIILPKQILSAYNYVARTPADLPIVAAAAAKWPSGRTRIVLAGYGDQPKMVFDGPDSEGAEIAARDAYSEAGDQWASAEYRSDVAAALVVRCLSELNEMDQG
jgi:CO/xanthine dehydrogenase FAD-binding subunit